MWLNLADLAYDVTTLGPGRRIVVWVQGCLLRCPGCISPEWQPLRANQLVRVDELAERLLERPDHHGLTLSGGEPMLQARSLLRLWRLVQVGQPEWNLIVFSGFTRRQLLTEGQPDRVGLLLAADAFIAGPYLQAENESRGLRGSANQEIFFGPRSRFDTADRRELLAGARRVEVRIEPHRVLIIGIPIPNLRAGTPRWTTPCPTGDRGEQ